MADPLIVTAEAWLFKVTFIGTDNKTYVKYMVSFHDDIDDAWSDCLFYAREISLEKREPALSMQIIECLDRCDVVNETPNQTHWVTPAP